MLVKENEFQQNVSILVCNFFQQSDDGYMMQTLTLLHD